MDELVRLLKAKHVMQGPPARVDSDAPVREIARTMLETGAQVVAVERDGRLAGVVTERDLLRYTEWHLETEDAAEDQRDTVIASQLELSERIGFEEARAWGMHLDQLRRVTAGQVMRAEVSSVRAESSLEGVMELLTEGAAPCLFVVAADHSVVGSITPGDVLRVLNAALFHRTGPASDAARRATRRRLAAGHVRR